MKKLYTVLLLFVIGLMPSFLFSQAAGTTCSNPITLYLGSTCTNQCATQYCGYYTSETGDHANTPMTGTSTLNPACTTDNETTQKVEWLEITATATSFSITNETNYTGGGAGTVEQKDYIVYSGTCGSLTQIACFASVLNGGISTVTGLTPGQTYLIMVSQSDASYAACSTCTAVATCVTSSVVTSPPVYDDCSNAYNLTTSVPYEATNAYSTADGPGVCESPLSGSVENNIWFKWCAPAGWPAGQNAFLNINSQVCNSTQGMQFAVYGPNPTCASIAANTATSIVCQNPNSIANLSYTFAPVAGNCYLINCDGYAATACTFLVEVSTTSLVCAPPTIVANSASICPTGSTSLVASGATSYTWSPATGLSSTSGATVTANPTVTTVYTIVGSQGGCNGSKTVTVTVNSAPTLTISGTSTVCPGLTTSLTASGGSTYTWTPSSTLSSATGSLVTSTPTADVTYTISSTSAAGCTNTAVKSVSISPSPTVAITSSPTSSICMGSAISFTAATANTYTWSGPAGNGLSGTSGAIVSATPSVSGSLTYTVNASSAAGCTTTAVKTITVVANPTVAVNNATICNGVSAILTASNATSYLWNPGGAVTASISVTPTITSFYTVTGTTAGCSDIKTATVTVNPIPTTSATTNGTISCATPTISLTSTLSGMSYTWTAPTGGSVTTATTQNTSAFGGPGTYSLFVQSAAGCTFSTTTSVTQNTTVPTGVNAGSNQTLGCGSSTVVALTGSVSTPGNATASWTGPSVSGSTTSFTTSANGAGIYTLTATDPINGCTRTSTVEVFPNAGAPSLTVNPVTNTITCTNTLVTVSISSTVSPASYNWSGTGIVSDDGAGTITVSQGGTFNYTLTNTTNSCTASGNTVVVQNTTIPITNLSTTDVLTCATPTIDLNSTLAGMSYTWTAPAGGSFGSANTQTTTATGVAGTYSLFVIDPTNDCSYTATLAVTQNITPPTTIPSTTGTLTCVTSTVSLNSNLTGMTYTWTAPSGGIVNPANTETTVASGAIGDYTLTIVDLTNGCTFTTTTLVTENITTPTGVSAGSNQILTCPANSVTLTGSVTTPTDALVNWTGGVCGTATTIVTSACAAGDYTLTVTDPLNGCTTASVVTVFPNIGAPTLTISATSLIIDCNNLLQPVTVTSTPSTDVIYNWNITPFSASVDSSSAVLSHAGTYIATVTNTLSNCTNTISVVVSENIAIPTTVASTTGTLTCVTSTVSLNSNLTGMTYTWTAPSGGSVNPANTETTVASGAVGDYTLTIIDVTNGCKFTTTTLVTENIAIPTGVSAGSNQILTCPSNSVTLTGSVTTPTDAIVNWTGGVCGTATTIVTSACAAGDYTLTVTDPLNGCTAESIVTVFPNAGTPTVTISSPTLVLDCNNPVKSVTVTSTPNTDVTYVWDNAPTTVSPDGSIASFANTNTYIATVTNTLSSCSATVQVVVSSDMAIPSISIAPDQTLTCANPTAVISTTTSASVTYTWTGALLSGQSTGTVMVNQPDNYTVNITAANGCTNTTSSNVSSDANVPVVTINVTSTNSVITCQSPTVSLIATATPTATSYSFSWSPTGTIGQTENATSANVYTVVVLNSVTGCTAASVPYTVTSNMNPPSITVSNTVIPCGSPSVVIGAIVTPTNIMYAWTTSGTGSILSGSATPTPTVGSAGQYVVTAMDNDNGCMDTKTVTVTSTGIIVGFTANPLSGTAPLLVNFTNQSTPGSLYSWTFGDNNNNTATSTDASHTFTATGNYVVTLVATDASSLCSSTATISIEVFESATLIVPNVFTPNGDNSNDHFKIISTGMKDLTCDIFNRWGTKIYTIKTINDSWDGSGSSDGTYFFILEAKGIDGKEFKQQGFISLFR